jgi:Ankyrin repeat
LKIEEIEDEEAEEEEVEEEARDDDEIKQEKENEKGESNEGDTQNEDPAESSGPAVAEVVASPTEPMQETSEHSSEEATHPTEDAEKNAEEGNEEDGAPGAEGEGRVGQDNNDTVGDFIDNEDDFEVPQDGPQAEGPGSRASEPDLRYEITRWVYHVREAEKRWTKEEMKENSEWKELWDLLEQFLFRTPKAFKAWRRIYWQTADNLPLHFWYNDVGPMHVAAAFGLTRFIENIIQKGYSISERTSMNEIPLHLASKSTQVDKELLEILLKTDPQPNFMTETWVRPPFHTVLTTAQPFEVVELFLHYGANCTMKDNRGDSCLHLYAYWGQDLRILDLLLAKGANINAKDGAGETPLHRLLQRLEPPIEMIRKFLKAGADIGMEDNYSQREPAPRSSFDGVLALSRK